MTGKPPGQTCAGSSFSQLVSPAGTKETLCECKGGVPFDFVRGQGGGVREG